MENKTKDNEVDSEDVAGASQESDSLETKTTIDATADGDVTDATGAAGESAASEAAKKKKKLSHSFFARFNIYLLLFIFLLVLAVAITVVSFIKSKQASTKATQIVTEPLSQEALEQLRQTDVKVGDPKQILSVESNAIFAGKVLIRDSLEVAGEIKAGAPLSIPGITVSGTSILGQVQANELQVAGNTTIQGQLAVQNNLTVSGSGTFGGALTAASLNIQNLQINGDLQLARHIDAGGGTPSSSGGSALGSGGTSSVSGTDTAGTATINTGGGTTPGCFITINFTQRFNGSPHVVITPIGPAAGSLNYYINRTTTSFSICSVNAAGTGTSFAFDYIVVD